MRRRTLWRGVLLLALAATTAQALFVHRPQKHPKQQVEELESQWRSAALAGDAVSMDRLLSDDYVGISWTGEVCTKAMQLDHVRTRSFVLTRLDVTDTKVKLVGNVAVVTALARVEGKNDGTAMNGIFRYTRVYQRLAIGTWKITNFEVTRVPAASERRHPSPDPIQ